MLRRKPRFSRRAVYFRRARWVLRFASISLLSVLAIVLLAAFTAWLLVTPEMLKARIAAQLEKTFNRPVKIDHVTFLLHQGIKVGGLEVRESKDFPGEVFLSSEFLIAKYKLSNLLMGRLDLSLVRLISPKIRLSRRADGRWNISEMMQPGGAQERSRGFFVLPSLHTAELIEIRRGSLIVDDVPRRLKLKVDDFELSARRFNTRTPFKVRFKFDNVVRIAGKSIRADVKFDGRVSLGGFRPEEASIAPENLQVVCDGKLFTVSGVLRNAARPVFNLRFKMPRLDSRTLSRYREVPEGIDIPPSEWSVKGKALEDGSIEIEKLAFSAGAVRAAVSGTLGPRASTATLIVHLPKVPLAAAAKFYSGWAERNLTGTADGSITLAGRFGKLEVERATLALGGFSATLKQNRRIFDADITLKASDHWRNMKVKVAKGNFVYYGSGFNDIALEFRVARGDIIVPRFEATWADSRIKLRGCMKNFRKLGRVYADVSSDRLRIDQTYAEINNIIARKRAERGETLDKSRGWANVFKLGLLPKYPAMTGRLRVKEAYSPNFKTRDFNLDWDLRGLTRGLKDLAGDFHISFGPGRVENVPEVRASNGLLNVLILPFSFMHELQHKARISLDTAILKTLDIEQAEGLFVSDRGNTHVRYIRFDSPQFRAFADGWIHFPPEKIDMKVLMRASGSGARLPERLQDSEGRPSIELNLKDDLNVPSYPLTFRKMGKMDLEKAVAVGLKRGRKITFDESMLDCGRGNKR